MLKKYSIKKQFIIIFFLAIIASMVTFGILLNISTYIINEKILYPANYYEKQVPTIEKYIYKKKESILEEKSREDLEKVISLDGFKYKVYSIKDKSSYGNFNIKAEDVNTIFKKINTVTANEINSVVKVIPVISKDNNISGVVYLNYDLRLKPNPNRKKLASIIQLFLLISPFLFLIIYSSILGKKLSKNLEKPINELIDASTKIQMEDLNFTLDYPYDNEIGKLVKSFETMRNELSKTLRKKWEVEMEKKDMIAALSHDLKTPLTVIKGHTELLQEGAYMDETRLLRYLNSIESSVERAILLVEDLKLLSKLENPDFELEFEKVNIREFIYDKIEEYIPICDEKHININVKLINIQRDTRVYFDKLRLTQVLDNIISNAIRYSLENGIIEIEVIKGNNKLSFKISDNGRGFNKEELNNIFTKFYKGDKSRGKFSGNSGLGLYIAKIIVEKHGGIIKCYNNDGAVIEFCIR